MKKVDNIETLEYKKLSPEEMKSRGILGRLIGICASFIDPTRNGRRYSEELWEKVFSNPIMKEKIDNKVIYGELGHPQDREEIDMSKAAVCLAELPQKGKDGRLRAVFDILDTPNGRILKTLCDYGSILGVSSRGTGEVETNFLGEDTVDPDSYNCETFDIVCLPAVKEARLKYVTESYNGKTLKEALTESLNSASEEEKEIMKETIDSLDISLNEEESQEEIKKEKIDDYKQETVDNKEPESETETIDNVEVDIVKDLQEALEAKLQLEVEITKLQEKLSVGYAKENKLNEELSKCKSTIIALSESAKTVKALKAKLQTVEGQLSEVKDEINKRDKYINSLKTRVNESTNNSKVLNESISVKEEKISALNEQIIDLKSTKSKLLEEIEDFKKDSQIKEKEYSTKLLRANKLVENYKSIANKSVQKYIESQALRLGIKSEDIKARLSESCSFSEIDRVCEDLTSYKVNMSRLPFDIDMGKSVKVGIKTPETSIIPDPNFDDEIDNQLIKLAEI